MSQLELEGMVASASGERNMCLWEAPTVVTAVGVEMYIWKLIAT
jgi:hypothetical protein